MSPVISMNVCIMIDESIAIEYQMILVDGSITNIPGFLYIEGRVVLHKGGQAMDSHV